MPFTVHRGRIRWWMGDNHSSFVDCRFIGRDGDLVGIITPGSGFRVVMIHEVGPVPVKEKV